MKVAEIPRSSLNICLSSLSLSLVSLTILLE